METGCDKEKVKRTSLSIKDKLKIIEQIKASESATNLAVKFKVTRQAINRIKRSESKILATKNVLTNCDGSLTKKKYKAAEDSLLDRKLYEWFKQRRSMGLVVTGVILKKKALQFNNRLGGKENFVASDGWLTCFKLRHGIKEKVIHGEKLSANVVGSEIFKEKMKNLREVTGIDLKYIYNCDETALY
ncbi:tigger transposable element-derived protein 2-like [Microplitis mediator]|uniref:tigger transposable element-derived protein 2-like n=1 Tax=Microplitis mediator TaxID=375433 RepID=UPI0025551097|nr:tigger transposable element-derived protein 2-like [Microplitis mediator]